MIPVPKLRNFYCLNLLTLGASLLRMKLVKTLENQPAVPSWGQSSLLFPTSHCIIDFENIVIAIYSPGCLVFNMSLGAYFLLAFIPAEASVGVWLLYNKGICCRFKAKSISLAAGQESQLVIEPEVLMTREVERTDSWDLADRERDIRQGIDLATTLERIEKNFVITDPRIPDNPIVSFIYFIVLCALLHNMNHP